MESPPFASLAFAEPRLVELGPRSMVLTVGMTTHVECAFSENQMLMMLLTLKFEKCTITALFILFK